MHGNTVTACEPVSGLAAKKLPDDVDSRSVFTSNELDLSKVSVYGFDYDYTLARYKPSLNGLIYDLARRVLVSDFKYPAQILDYEYVSPCA
jgi:hypothetical protein